jgi:hypothetical protein
MKRLLLLILLLPSVTIAQTVSNVTSRQNGNMIEINYNINDISPNQTVKVILFYSLNSSNYIGPLQKVSGDIGDFISGNGNKKITWDVLAELGSLEGETKFKVEIIPNTDYKFPSASGSGAKVNIMNCSLKQTTLILDLMFESETDRDWVFYSNRNAFYDSNGSKYQSNSIKVGNNPNKEYETITLMKGIPIRVQLVFLNVPENLKNLPGFEFGFHYGETLRFRNISVIKN